MRRPTRIRARAILGALIPFSLGCARDAPTAPPRFTPPASTTAVHLVPGEFATLAGAQIGAGFTIPLASESRSYVVAVHDSRATPGAVADLRFSVVRLVGIASEVTPRAGPRPSLTHARAAAARSAARQDPFDAWLAAGGEARFREAVSRQLETAGARVADPRARAGAPIVRGPPWRASSTARGGSTPSVGDLLEFGSPVQADGSLATCSSPVRVTGLVKAVGPHFVVVEDTAVAGGFLDADFTDLLTEIEQVAFPVDSAYFGLPSDLDGNGKVIALVTGEVNRLGAAGFFTPGDLAATADCPAGNEAELLWLLAPDPLRRFGVEPVSASLLRSRLPGIVAHELQHLIHAERRIFEAGGDLTSADVTWLNEGLSHVAEEVSGLYSAGRRAGENLGFEDLGQPQTAARFDRYHLNSFRFVRDYLEAPGTVPAIVDEAVTVGNVRKARGFGYLLLRWVADQFATGGGAGIVATTAEEDLFRSLAVGGPGLETSIDNLLASLASATGVQRRWEDLFAEYVAAPAVDDVTEPQIPLSPVLRLTTWNLPAVYENAAANGLEADFPVGFPLIPRLILPGTLPAGGFHGTFSLQPSTAVYFRIEGVGATPQSHLQVFTASGLPLSASSSIQVTIVRTF